jgi:hypothetical protein
MNLSTGKKFTKSVDKSPHELSIKRLSALGIGKIQTIENCLRYYVVELFEKLLLAFFIESWVLN